MTGSEIANLYNNDNLNLQEISKKLGISKSTVQRRLSSDGWVYDKESKKYINDSLLNDTLGQCTKESNKKIKLVSRTYNISCDIDMALKLKAVLEDKNIQDIVNDLLRKSIEDKYFKYQI